MTSYRERADGITAKSNVRILFATKNQKLFSKFHNMEGRLKLDGIRNTVLSHPVDSKREEFRKYLEKAGVLDVLTRALVELLDEAERPTDALEFLRQHLTKSNSHKTEIDNLQDELNKINEQLKQLQAENNNLKAKLQKYEGSHISSNNGS